MVRFNTDCFLDGTPIYMYTAQTRDPKDIIIKVGTIGYVREGVYDRWKGVMLDSGLVVQAYSSFIDFRRHQVGEYKAYHKYGITAWLVIGDTDKQRNDLFETFTKQSKFALWSKK